ncbi:MAG: sugar transferase [Candidatus Omnitrophica bacterium]|nr:sugar transferase [Candidatus Omnitrophota bacterium]
MLKEHATIFRRLAIFGDLCIIAGSFFLGYFFRNKIQDIYPLEVYIGLLPVLLLSWGSLLYFFGMHKPLRIRRLGELLLIIFKAAGFSFIIFATYVYIFKLHYISRAFIMFVFIFAALLISFEKIALMIFFRKLRRRGFNFRQILIIGTGQRAQHFISLVHSHSEWGLRIVGIVDDDPAKVGKTVSGHKVLGTFKDVPNIVHGNVVDEVVFVVPRSWLNKIEGLMHFCESEGLKVNVAVDIFKLKFSRAKQTDLAGFPLLSFESTPEKLGHLLIKRLLDMIISTAGLIILSPLFLVIPLIIKATSPGPVFFRQQRSGLNGRRFNLYKFRTMTKDAEAKLSELLQYNEMNGPAFKMENDPRLTKIGGFLRKFSLDELPQLWNVFRGDMSLVGPRPPIPKEVEKYDNWQRRRLSMRPGITCLWQANGRNRINDFSEWAKLDLEYIDNWSLGLDFKIIFKTVPAVLFAHGAK